MNPYFLLKTSLTHLRLWAVPAGLCCRIIIFKIVKCLLHNVFIESLKTVAQFVEYFLSFLQLFIFFLIKTRGRDCVPKLSSLTTMIILVVHAQKFLGPNDFFVHSTFFFIIINIAFVRRTLRFFLNLMVPLSVHA